MGELVHLETASDEWTDAWLLGAIPSGLLAKWAQTFPAPRREAAIGMEGMVAAHLAARFAGLSAMRHAGSVRRSASGLGAVGSRVEGLEPEQGGALRGPSDDQRISGDGRRTRLVTLDKQVNVDEPGRLPPVEPRQLGKGRQRAARRAAQGAVHAVEAEARAQRGSRKLLAWDHDHVGPSLLQDARPGKGRRRPRVATTPVAVGLEPGPSAWSGVGKQDDGNRARGDTWATFRPLLEQAGLSPQGDRGPWPVHDLPACRRWCETAPVVRKGDG